MGGIWKQVLHVLCANAVAMVLFLLMSFVGEYFWEITGKDASKGG